MLSQSPINSQAFRAIPTPTSRGIAPLPRPTLPRPAPIECGEAGALDQTMHLMGAVMAYPRNAEIFGENEPAEFAYKIISGSVRTYKILNDGRRQIGAFYLPGDVFGLPFEDEHSLSAEAVTNVKVLVVKRSALNTVASRDTSISRDIIDLTGRELRRTQRHVLLLIKSAQERVASFLLEMSERVETSNSIELPNSVDLPMSRQDIADYLGLTIETVSRTLTALETAAAIALPTSRRVMLRNRSALIAMMD
jgi:CRP/FNR family transcriptional regulator, nitrogen fixation regulation protein